jgi:hypothetical protein
LLASQVIAGITGYCWHRGLLLASCVIAGTAHHWYVWLQASYMIAGTVHHCIMGYCGLLLAPWFVVGIVDCWHCRLLLASRVIAGIAGYC